jgi:antitoxin (DNA-binding transcriptional repressor) of toxin-antitoxin stability system
MKGSPGIAELKAHLSDYVRAAQKGKEFIVKDRDTPVAKLSPVGLPRPALPVIRATRSMAEVERMLDAAPHKSPVPDAAIDRAIHENKRDVSDQWIAGELT